MLALARFLIETSSLYIPAAASLVDLIPKQEFFTVDAAPAINLDIFTRVRGYSESQRIVWSWHREPRGGKGRVCGSPELSARHARLLLTEDC